MRACFLGHNICALGYGVAMLQMPPVSQVPVNEADKKALAAPCRLRPTL